MGLNPNQSFREKKQTIPVKGKKTAALRDEEAAARRVSEGIDVSSGQAFPACRDRHV